MRIAIPRRVKLRGRWWSVRLTSKPKRAEMHGLRGLCDLDERAIWIDRSCGRPERELTYVHEVLHAIWPRGVVTHEAEEELISALERPLAEAIARGAFMISPPDEVP